MNYTKFGQFQTLYKRNTLLAHNIVNINYLINNNYNCKFKLRGFKNVIKSQPRIVKMNVQ